MDARHRHHELECQRASTPGTNTLRAYAEDNGGNLSATGKVSLFRVVLTTLTVQTNGLGFVTPDYDGKLLEIGRSYTVTAKTRRGAFSTTGVEPS